MHTKNWMILSVIIVVITIMPIFHAFGYEKQDEQKIFDVIVIGAGISGISAADALTQLGYDVVVLEAKDRIGGRVWTDNSTGILLDMGASWIHGVKYNPLYVLAQKYGIETVQTVSESNIQSHIFYDYEKGRKLSSEEQGEIENRFDDFDKSIYLKYSYIPTNTFQAKFFDPIFQYARYSDKSIGESLHEYLKETNQLDKIDEFEGMSTYWYTNTWNTDIDNISLRHYGMEKEYGGEEVIFPNGYSQIVEKLSQEIEIRKNHMVSKIEYDADWDPVFGVNIFDQGKEVLVHGNNTKTGDSFTLKSKFVIITVPLGVLKDSVSETQLLSNEDGLIIFEPPLPKEKVESIKKIGMGVMNKAWLIFPYAFWSTEPDSQYIAVLKDEHETEWALFFNADKFLDMPILLGFNSGNYARQLESMPTDEDIKNEAMKTIKKIYPDAPEPDDYLISSWSIDPFTRGAYSYPAVGSTPTDNLNLAKDVGAKLFFAGEATAPEAWGTVHGAYLSGIRAAENVDFWYSWYSLYKIHLYVIIAISIGLAITWGWFLRWRVTRQLALDAMGKTHDFPWRGTAIIVFTALYILSLYYFFEFQLGVIPDLIDYNVPIDDECFHLSKLIDAMPYMRLSPEEENVFNQQFSRCMNE